MEARGQPKPTRRQFLKALGAGSALALSAPLLAACGQPAAPAPTATAATTPAAAAAPTTAPAAVPTATAAPTTAAAEPTATAAPVEATPTAAASAAGQVKEVPRSKTLIVMWQGQNGKYIDWDLWNPFAVGATHQTGANQIFEPLAYYSAFADKTYMWLAEDYEYSSDYKELTVKTRKGVSWSDGQPFSARDVAFTFNTLKELGSKVIWGTETQMYVDSVNATDDNTVVFKFKVPAPRFFDFVTYKYDIGVYIAPKHIYEGKDWTSFKNFDVARGWPVTTGPWTVAAASPESKTLDRREEWWAVKQGLVPRMPAMERILWVPLADETAAAQAMIRNEVDHTHTKVELAKQAVDENPKVTTHSGREAPYGYTDWWPLSLYVNCSKKPFDDKDVRWALSYYINREQIIEVGYSGYGSTWPLPMPSYPPLRPYVDAV